jgi:hypothetical protein
MGQPVYQTSDGFLFVPYRDHHANQRLIPCSRIFGPGDFSVPERYQKNNEQIIEDGENHKCPQHDIKLQVGQ